MLSKSIIYFCKVLALIRVSYGLVFFAHPLGYNAKALISDLPD